MPLLSHGPPDSAMCFRPGVRWRWPAGGGGVERRSWGLAPSGACKPQRPTRLAHPTRKPCARRLAMPSPGTLGRCAPPSPLRSPPAASIALKIALLAYGKEGHGRGRRRQEGWRGRSESALIRWTMPGRQRACPSRTVGPRPPGGNEASAARVGSSCVVGSCRLRQSSATAHYQAVAVQAGGLQGPRS